jgi:hypothetical protein
MSLPSECAVRLVTGLLFNMALLWMIGPMARWRSIEHEFGMALVCAAIGTVALVSVAPLLRRGTAIQKVAAIVLMVLPLLAFWPALDVYLHYR